MLHTSAVWLQDPLFVQRVIKYTRVSECRKVYALCKPCASFSNGQIEAPEESHPDEPVNRFRGSWRIKKNKNSKLLLTFITNTCIPNEGATHCLGQALPAAPPGGPSGRRARTRRRWRRPHWWPSSWAWEAGSPRTAPIPLEQAWRRSRLRAQRTHSSYADVTTLWKHRLSDHDFVRSNSESESERGRESSGERSVHSEATSVPGTKQQVVPLPAPQVLPGVCPAPTLSAPLVPCHHAGASLQVQAV